MKLRPHYPLMIFSALAIHLLLPLSFTWGAGGPVCTFPDPNLNSLPEPFAFGTHVLVSRSNGPGSNVYNIGIGNTSPAARLDLLGGSKPNLFKVDDSGNNSLLSISNQGSIQIGKSAGTQTTTINSPQTQIQGSLNITGNMVLNGDLSFQYPTTSTAVFTGTLGVNQAPSNSLDILTSGSSPSWAAFQITDITGSNLLTVTQAGKVGLGANHGLNTLGGGSWPSQALEVGGEIRVTSGFIQIPDLTSSRPGCSTFLDGVVILYNGKICVCKADPTQWSPTWYLALDGTTAC
jgi:hypothetical protein